VWHSARGVAGAESPLLFPVDETEDMLNISRELGMPVSSIVESGPFFETLKKLLRLRTHVLGKVAGRSVKRASMRLWKKISQAPTLRGPAQNDESDRGFDGQEP